ncbi:hypothetical protein CP973_14905 [Streptomyces albofaciens JCM 4342]|uniref:DUF6167 family protein n=1 Tax=Streptomyces albofaciens TaxID=66866 RepID=UPI00123BC4F4|nr:DUF6167 family protein [Streptomyces albofaciens]KAA6223035.1 hypothetical protein CP973_14905 [Streptomyces albofaciens JCM 4342]
MFRRAFWFTTGAAAGVWATTKVNRKLRKLQPDSLAAQAAGKAVETGHRLRQFAVDVRTGMADREGQLYEALGLTDRGDARELPPARSRPALRTPQYPITQHRTITPGPTGPTGKEDH